MLKMRFILSFPYKKILITGGAGFVGSNLAIFLKRDFPELQIEVLDNLYRRGSELSIPRLQNAKIKFIHGDVRILSDIKSADQFDLMIECSAEPSVKAGYNSSSSYLLQTNVSATLNCLEVIKEYKAALIFLSTSRVYSIENLKNLALDISEKRFLLKSFNNVIGITNHGINKNFSTQGTKTLYGASKLASEILIQEYCKMYDLSCVINRCGVIAGPWQMGKADQGFLSLWLANHLFNKPLKYIGFGGKGYQVRDILHIEDLYDLFIKQLMNISSHNGKIYNVGGGAKNSISLFELSKWCQKNIANKKILQESTTHPTDIPFYVTDNAEIYNATGWIPKRNLDLLLNETLQWMLENRQNIERFF
jgi:CDP-paratose 2-epimerase